MITVLLLALVVVSLFLWVVAKKFNKIPPSTREGPRSAIPIGPAWLRLLISADPRAELLTAVVVAALFGISLVLVALYATRRYAWVVFILTPFAVGFAASFFVSCHRAPTRGRCVRAASLAVVTASLGFLALGVEGFVCLLMAAPLTIPCAIVGALLAFFVQHSRREALPLTVGMLLCALPLMATVEPALIGAPPPLAVQTSIEIDAPAAVVWAHLIRFESIEAPLDSWLFKAGVAYPISAELRGQGVGAIRVCEFSTGTFVETIRRWDVGRELAFTVDEAPSPLREWTPYENVHPPHLDGYFLPESADFRLVALGANRTRLEGTSVYRHHMWPIGYWRLWSDAMIKQVHLRVFQHVKRLAEHASRPAMSRSFPPDARRAKPDV
jgi:hypothetical protein